VECGFQIGRKCTSPVHGESNPFCNPRSRSHSKNPTDFKKTQQAKMTQAKPKTQSEQSNEQKQEDLLQGKDNARTTAIDKHCGQ